MRRNLEKKLADKVEKYQLFLLKEYGGGPLIPKEKRGLVDDFLNFAINNAINKIEDIPQKFDEIFKK